MSKINEVDWAGLITKCLNVGIDILARKVEGVQSTEGAGVNVGYSGISFSFSKMFLTVAVIGLAIVGAVILLRRI